MAKETTNIPSLPTTFKIGDVEVNKETLELRLKEDTLHTISGVSDVAAYKQAVALRALYRGTRTTLAKKVKELQEPHKKFIAGLKTINDELAAICEKGEEYFNDLIVAIDTEKERLKKEKELAQQRLIQSRANKLFSYSANFDGENYTLPYDEGVVANLEDLSKLPEQEWQELLQLFNDAHVRHENKLTVERLEQEQRENDLLQAAEQTRLDQEHNAAVAKVLTNKRTWLRLKEITLMGFVEDENKEYYIHPKGIKIVAALIPDFFEDSWETKIEQWQAEIDNYIEPELTPEQIKSYNDLLLVNDGKTLLTNEIKEMGVIATGNPVSEPEQSYVNNESQEEAEPIDYSLNDFENLTRSSYNGTKKQKETILEAIASYKEAMDRF